jgi:hypothetical protein
MLDRSANNFETSPSIIGRLSEKNAPKNRDRPNALANTRSRS